MNINAISENDNTIFTSFFLNCHWTITSFHLAREARRLVLAAWGRGLGGGASLPAGCGAGCGVRGAGCGAGRHLHSDTCTTATGFKLDWLIRISLSRVLYYVYGLELDSQDSII